MDNIEIQPEEVERKLAEDKNMVIVDVREEEEIEQGMIEGAIHIPLKKIPQSIDKFTNDKHYVFVCHSGARSAIATEFFDAKGYEARNMVGGMLAWRGEIII